MGAGVVGALPRWPRFRAAILECIVCGRGGSAAITQKGANFGE